MKLNRKQRRARGNWRGADAADTPQKQFRDFLKAPGRMYIIQLPGEKSTVMKVADTDETFFRLFCAQLQGVLGDEFQVIPATPVDASVATAQDIANSTAASTKRIREARARQAEAEVWEAALDKVNSEAQEALDATIARHPAGKQRSGRHRAAEDDTAFDRLVAAGPVDNDEGAKRLAAMEIAAAQDAARAASDALEEANRRLRDAYDRGGELHNRAVLDRFTEQASDALAEQADREGVDDGPPLIPGVDVHLADDDLARRREDAIADARRRLIEEARALHGMETGHDMGLTHAAEMFPQHTKQRPPDATP